MTMPAILIDINLVWQIINFCVIMFIFKKKLFGPVSKIISERKALITKDMDDAKKDKEEAEKSKVKAEAELKKAAEQSARLEKAEEGAVLAKGDYAVIDFKGFVDGGLFRGGGSGSGADAGNRGIGCGDSRLRCGNGGGFSLFIVAHVNIQAQKGGADAYDDPCCAIHNVI